MERDRAHLCRPADDGDLRRADLVRVATRRELDPRRLQVVRRALRDALLEEGVAAALLARGEHDARVHALRPALERRRPPVERAHDAVLDGEVVLDDVELGDGGGALGLGEDHAVGARHAQTRARRRRRSWRRTWPCLTTSAGPARVHARSRASGGSVPRARGSRVRRRRVGRSRTPSGRGVTLARERGGPVRHMPGRRASRWPSATSSPPGAARDALPPARSHARRPPKASVGTLSVRRYRAATRAPLRGPRPSSSSCGARRTCPRAASTR